MLSILVLALLGQVAATSAAGSFDASKATVSAPTALMEIDAGKLKGNPIRLAWGDDDSLFLRVAEIDRWGNERGRNFIVKPGKPEPAPVDEEPSWASVYWMWKSGLTAPGVPTVRFDVETREQAKTAVGSTQEAEGFNNPNKSDPSQSQIAKDVASMQKVATTTVRFKGNLIVEAVNRGINPGMTFGWAPAPMGVLSYADAKKRLVLLDQEGRRFEVPGATEVLLPAWSPDGKRIAYLQKKDRKRYALNVVTIEAK
jgi:hypothetical protein